MSLASSVPILSVSPAPDPSSSLPPPGLGSPAHVSPNPSYVSVPPLGSLLDRSKIPTFWLVESKQGQTNFIVFMYLSLQILVNLMDLVQKYL